MARLFPALLLTASLLLAGCGQVLVGFVSNPQVPSSSISGVVIVVRLGSANDSNGQPVTLTAVTFSNAGLSNDMNFCGDQRSQFPLNQSVRVQFNPGALCSNLVSVVSL